MKEELSFKTIVQRNSQLVNKLHRKVHETFAQRSVSSEAWNEWIQAATKFRDEYDALAFPGGYEEGLQKIRTGDNQAIEMALAFLEVRPYFFRSQYMKTKLIRLLRSTSLSPRQKELFKKVLESDSEYKKSKQL